MLWTWVSRKRSKQLCLEHGLQVFIFHVTFDITRIFGPMYGLIYLKDVHDDVYHDQYLGEMDVFKSEVV
jgi:hypothetical protein